MDADLEPEVTLPWLVRLRWLFLTGQAITLGVVFFWSLQVNWPLLLTGACIGLVSNVMLDQWTRRDARARAAWVIGGVLILDTALLTLLLSAAGGPMNPFTVLYLVNITLSAVVLSARWTAVLAALSIGGFGLLFLLPGAEHASSFTGLASHGDGLVARAAPQDHAHGFHHHLHGMWGAFVLASVSTSFFVGRISRAISIQREQIAALRETSARNARLAALTTLAAGAAHELGTPLATIAVAAHEARLQLARMAGADAVADDVHLILLEVDRCQDILHQMAARASETTDSAAPLAAAELERRLRGHLGEERAARVDVRLPAALCLDVPAQPLVTSLAALVNNALEAGGPDDPVQVEVGSGAGALWISVIDHGAGIDAAVLSRVGEPFFTTKPPGRGMGLGVYLARAFVESLGGGLIIESTPGRGTRATMRLPHELAGTQS